MKASPNIDARLGPFQDQSTQLLASIAHYLDNYQAQEAAVVSRPVPLDPNRLDALRAALDTQRPRQARRLFTELRAGLLQTYGVEAVDGLADAMDRLRFDEALALLTGLMRDRAI